MSTEVTRNAEYVAPRGPVSHACQTLWSYGRPKEPHHEECDGWAGLYVGMGLFTKWPRCYCLCHGHGGYPYADATVETHDMRKARLMAEEYARLRSDQSDGGGRQE